jgi:hypothetical protein
VQILAEWDAHRQTSGGHARSVLERHRPLAQPEAVTCATRSGPRTSGLVRDTAEKSSPEPRAITKCSDTDQVQELQHVASAETNRPAKKLRKRLTRERVSLMPRHTDTRVSDQRVTVRFSGDRLSGLTGRSRRSRKIWPHLAHVRRRLGGEI